MSQKILVALDDSGPARNALEYALENHPNGDITALHVIDTYRTAAPYDYQPGEIAELQEEHAEDLLSTADDIAESHGTTVKTRYVRGEAVDRIEDYVNEHGIDLVVIGSHGRSGVRRFFLGSVAEEVVRRLHVPVTVVSSKED